MDSCAVNSVSAERPLRWLLAIRWLSAGVQLALLAAAYFIPLDVSAPRLLMLGVLILFSNTVAAFSLRNSSLPVPNFLGFFLLADTLVITLLLTWTGGPYNPFTILYLVQISLAAVALKPLWAWLLTIFSSIGFYSLFILAAPVSSHSMHHDDPFSLHLYGMLIAFVFTAALVSFMLSKLSSALLRSERALSEMRLQKLNEQRLASLATLAAGAAHELSTPLTTIAVTKSEISDLLERAPAPTIELRRAARTIGDQVQRCKSILANMAGRSGAVRGEAPELVRVVDCIEDAAAQLRNRRSTKLNITVDSRDSKISVIQESLRQVLTSLLQNAVDASSAAGSIDITAKRIDEQIVVTVKDRGHGMSSELLAVAKEPFFTTKPVGSGMGLGLFLADLYARQFGGELSIDSAPGVGTTATLKLPVKTGLEELAANA
ncbi:MAG: HAMP domain-containing histidine kinase [Bdellovibrionales bacterium]|nr:HAMP domain-containing histidine kinase [Bdellovibrionales bacterium]